MSIRLRSPNSAKTDSLNKSVDSATSFTSELSAEAKKKKVLTVYKPRGESPAVVQSKPALQTPEHDEDSPSIFEKLRGHLLKALFFVLNGILLVCILILQGIGFVFAIVFKMILIASAKLVELKNRTMRARKKRAINRSDTNLRFSQLNKWDKVWEYKAVEKPFTLVLALNKCLIKAAQQRNDKTKEIITVENLDSKKETYYFSRRPHLEEFLDKVSSKYKVVVFTSAQQYFADPILDLIDKYKQIDHRYYRDSCERRQEGLVKKLEVIGEDPEKIIVVDHQETPACTYKKNLILIKPWQLEEKDDELLKLMNFLMAIPSNVGDVRNILQQQNPSSNVFTFSS